MRLLDQSEPTCCLLDRRGPLNPAAARQRGQALQPPCFRSSYLTGRIFPAMYKIARVRAHPLRFGGGRCVPAVPWLRASTIQSARAHALTRTLQLVRTTNTLTCAHTCTRAYACTQTHERVHTNARARAQHTNRHILHPRPPGQSELSPGRLCARLH